MSYTVSQMIDVFSDDGVALELPKNFKNILGQLIP